MTLDEFKALAAQNQFKEKITGRSDVVDLDNGTMVIYAEHINRYLEKYACKDADDLSNTLWFSYGVYLKIVE